MKPWREIAVPHRDVLEGTFQQSEFAADITAVHTGKATPEYQDAVAFFERTFITEGMRLLLTQVAQRLAAKAASRSSSFRQPSAAARRTPCWRSITCHPQMPAHRNWRAFPICPRSGGHDGRAAGPRRGARRHAHCARPAVETWQASRSRRSGVNWPGSSAAAKALRW